MEVNLYSFFQGKATSVRLIGSIMRDDGLRNEERNGVGVGGGGGGQK